ncbi:MAG TPA: serine/threonine-protein kinase [Candidatus Limnocylindrales bacterium]|nr:serine/threonine-protein kinase [Candidatus Limnocylindrales bacterium]
MSATAQMLVDNRYRLVQPLGQGGMGRVWKARDEVLGRDVAIKELVPPPGLSAAERAEVRERAMREARAVARLNHPSVMHIHDVISTHDGDPWIVMEYLSGGSLHDLLTRSGTLTVQRAARIGLDLLGALQATHAVGIVHRDIKPANVLIAEDGRAVLTDFGIATVPGDPFVTRTGLLLGSPAYLAPERARGGGKVGPAADLWSLGATLYAAVEGSPPFARATTMETLAALATEPVPEPRHAGPLAPVLKGLLHKDPGARMSAGEAQRLLGPIAAGQAAPVPAFKPGRVSRQTAPAPPRPPSTRLLPPVIPQAKPRPRRPEPSRGGRKALVLFTVVVAGLLAAALAFDNRTAPEDSQPPASSPARKPPASSAAAPAASPSSVASPSPTGFVLPAGWQMQADGSGFRVPVPDGWEFGRDDDGRPFWREPRSGVLLLIDQRRDPQPDPVQDWLKNEAARKSGYRDYQRIRIEEVSYWDKAADWEFTYRSRGGNPLHVLNRGFITAPDQAYSIYWSTPASQWDSWRDDLQIVFDGFIPARV